MIKKFLASLCLFVFLLGAGFCVTSNVGGYFENWAQYRTGAYNGEFACTTDKLNPYVQGLDHLYYAFGFFRFGYDEASDPPYVDDKQYYKDHGESDWAIYPSEWNDTKSWNKADGNWAKIQSLKTSFPDLKIILSLGGWGFCSDDQWYSSTTKSFFPQLAKIATDAKTIPAAQTKLDTFLDSAFRICSAYDPDNDKYGFDGIDIDWEFPGSLQHGGTTNDYQGFFDLLDALKTKLVGKQISIAIPAVAPTDIVSGSYDAGGGATTVNSAETYLKWIADCSVHLDRLNIMCYDYYGAGYSSTTADNAPLHDYQGLTSLETTIDNYVAAFTTQGATVSKLVVGLASYGHTFANVNFPSTWDANEPWGPGCTYSGAGAAGPLTGQAGFLSYIELVKNTPPPPSGSGILNIADKKAGTPNNIGFTDYFSFMKNTILNNDEDAYYYDGSGYNTHTNCYYAYNYTDNTWVSFDVPENSPILNGSPSSIKAKIDFIKNKGVGGVMLWSLDDDYFTDRSQSILKTMVDNRW